MSVNLANYKEEIRVRCGQEGEWEILPGRMAYRMDGPEDSKLRGSAGHAAGRRIGRLVVLRLSAA